MDFEYRFSLHKTVIYLSTTETSVKRMTPSEELTKLQNKKAELEEEARSLEEKEKTLDERVKILEERLAIQELESRNERALNAVKELEAKIGEMEKRLRKGPEEPEVFTPPVEEPTPKAEEPMPEVEEPASEAIETVQEEEPIEEEVTVTAIEEPEAIEQPVEDQRRQHEKKKRKFF